MYLKLGQSRHHISSRRVFVLFIIRIRNTISFTVRNLLYYTSTPRILLYFYIILASVHNSTTRSSQRNQRRDRWTIGLWGWGRGSPRKPSSRSGSFESYRLTIFRIYETLHGFCLLGSIFLHCISVPLPRSCIANANRIFQFLFLFFNTTSTV